MQDSRHRRGEEEGQDEEESQGKKSQGEKGKEEKEEDEKILKEVKELKKELEDHRRPDLIINRVPKGELKTFKKLARLEFNNDYGVTLKFLLINFLEDAKIQDIIHRIGVIEASMEAYDMMKAQEHEEEEGPVYETLDGSKVRGRG